MTAEPRVVVIGAGMAGVSTAYQLTRRGITDLTLVDPRAPLTLTSDKSTECYRNWWPSRPMVGLMERSIDLLEEMSEESGDVFGLSRRGYLFVTADEERLEEMAHQAAITSSFGAGPVRRHPGPVDYGEAPEGADILDRDALGEAFPFVTDQAVGALHVRRAGWLGAQQLGAWMLDRARTAGATLRRAGVSGIEVGSGAVEAVVLDDGSRLPADAIVVAAGPHAAEVAGLAGVDLPLFTELHLKVVFRDHLGAVPRDAPMIIWSDPQHIDWSDEERVGLAELGRDELLGEMPVFCHGRPEGSEGSPYFLALWEYHKEVIEPTWPIADDPLYPEVVMRGLATMVPALSAYVDRLPASSVDGGYYTKTTENRPLIGPCGPDGLHVVAGLSGFGIMASPAAGELVARHVTGAGLPDYAPAFLLDRYQDPAYLEEMARGAASSGQL